MCGPENIKYAQILSTDSLRALNLFSTPPQTSHTSPD